MPRVLNKRIHGIPGDSVYVGRGSIWGNPYSMGRDGSREVVIAKFKAHVLPDLDVSALRDKDLVCFCSPKACHADLLLEKAN